MEITEVRIKLMDDPNDRLQAFCSITFDACFVIRDLKIIQGAKGSFVAMPSRKLTDRCPRCDCKNHLRAAHCSECGASLDADRAVRNNDGRAKLYADIAHPINSACRELIQQFVIRAYEEELVKSQQPGYICRYDDYGEENYAALRETDDNIDTDDNILPLSAHRRDEHANVRRYDAAHERDEAKRHSDSAPSTLPLAEGRKAEPREEDGFGAGLM